MRHVLVYLCVSPSISNSLSCVCCARRAKSGFNVRTLAFSLSLSSMHPDLRSLSVCSPVSLSLSPHPSTARRFSKMIVSLLRAAPGAGLGPVRSVPVCCCCWKRRRHSRSAVTRAYAVLLLLACSEQCLSRSGRCCAEPQGLATERRGVGRRWEPRIGALPAEQSTQRKLQQHLRARLISRQELVAPQRRSLRAVAASSHGRGDDR